MRELSNQLESPTKSTLFKAKSQVYNKTASYYNMYWSQSGIIRYSTEIIKLKTNILSNSNVNKDSKKSSNIKYDNLTYKLR